MCVCVRVCVCVCFSVCVSHSSVSDSQGAGVPEVMACKASLVAQLLLDPAETRKKKKKSYFKASIHIVYLKHVPWGDWETFPGVKW